ncbi:MAG: hypothetical protein ACRDOI_13105, partial [Trebonia sp.]
TSWTRFSGTGSPHARFGAAGDAAHPGQHVPGPTAGLGRRLGPVPCLCDAGPGQVQPVEEPGDVGG